jgi:DNA-binding LacI/PurR family transcriptional regulator
MSLWHGVAKAARETGCDLVVIHGGHPDTERNALFELAGKNSFDGIVSWAATSIGPHTEYLERMADKTPLISLSLKYPKSPCVRIDSSLGIRQAVEHLITVHGKKRFAFIKGEASTQIFTQRYQSCVDTITASGLSVDERLVVDLDQLGLKIARDGTVVKALSELLDKRKLVPGRDFDAILTVNEPATIHLLRGIEAARHSGSRGRGLHKLR